MEQSTLPLVELCSGVVSQRGRGRLLVKVECVVQGLKGWEPCAGRTSREVSLAKKWSTSVGNRLCCGLPGKAGELKNCPVRAISVGLGVKELFLSSLAPGPKL